MTWIASEPRPGHWMIRCCRGCPWVAARIWLCDHEPGCPENKIERPYLQGQIALDLVPPAEVWLAVEFCEASPEQQEEMLRPLPLRVDVRAGKAIRPATAPMALWKRQRARRITEAQFVHEQTWLRWAARNAPERLNYRQPEKPADVPIPRFTK